MKSNSIALMLKGCSLFAAILLAVGTGLVALAYSSDQPVSSTSFVVFIAGFAFAFLTLAAAVLFLSALANENARATDVAYKLSNGELYGGENGDSELLDSLRNASIYLKEKASAAKRIASGDLFVTVEPTSEADALGNAFQSMVQKLRETVQTQEERDALQTSVVKLLNEVSEVSAGDLTVQAEVAPGITGEIAQSFNSMTTNLRSLIRQIKDITLQVGVSATAISETTEQLARGSVAQASQVSRTTLAITSMAKQIQEVSENAALSARVAADSLASSRRGTKAAGDNINAMQSVRKQVQETAKRIKKLGERSQEIGQIVALIEDLSERTSLLALNASLQAAGAGEAGAGFAVVAEEVERLAERSNRLTQQISSLTHSINVETKEVVASMEETIHEVIVGSGLADKAGQSLVEIENVSSRLADLLGSISESAKFQAKSSEDISNAMSDISDVTDLVAIGSKRAAESVKTLVRLSGDLRGSVSPFKLPADANGRVSPDSNMFVN